MNINKIMYQIPLIIETENSVKFKFILLYRQYSQTAYGKSWGKFGKEGYIKRLVD